VGKKRCEEGIGILFIRNKKKGKPSFHTMGKKTVVYPYLAKEGRFVPHGGERGGEIIRSSRAGKVRRKGAGLLSRGGKDFDVTGHSSAYRKKNNLARSWGAGEPKTGAPALAGEEGEGRPSRT